MLELLLIGHVQRVYFHVHFIERVKGTGLKITLLKIGQVSFLHSDGLSDA